MRGCSTSSYSGCSISYRFARKHEIGGSCEVCLQNCICSSVMRTRCECAVEQSPNVACPIHRLNYIYVLLSALMGTLKERRTLIVFTAAPRDRLNNFGTIATLVSLFRHDLLQSTGRIFSSKFLSRGELPRKKKKRDLLPRKHSLKFFKAQRRFCLYGVPLP